MQRRNKIELVYQQAILQLDSFEIEVLISRLRLYQESNE